MTGWGTAGLRAGVRRGLRLVGLERRAGRARVERRLRHVLQERDAARRRVHALERDAAALTARADALAAELDAARLAQDLAAGRDRSDLGYLFVVTYGRSGSTLLQGILSATSGVVMRGENGGLLLDLYRAHTTATGHRDRLRRSSPLPPQHPWWGIDGYRDEAAYRGFRTLLLDTVLRPGPDTRIVGFKEIDWVREDMPGALPGVLRFTRQVFPGARFVLNTRNLADVARSKWWAGRPNALERLGQLQDQLVEALSPYGDDVYRVHYDDYVADPSRLAGLFEWVGVDVDPARVAEVMALRHSY